MASPNKPSKFNLMDILKWILFLISFIGAASFMFTASSEWGTFRAEIKEVTFDSSTQKNDHINHVNKTPNVIENYEISLQNKEMRVELDTLFGFVTAVFKEDIARIKIDSTNSSDAVISRAVRDSLNLKSQEDIADIQREMKATANTMQAILTELRKLKEE